MHNTIKSGISAGKDPMGLAAAVLYVSCLKTEEDKIQRDIADAAGVTEVTIRNRYKNIIKQLDTI
jgi:transcription initiation factor TFIIB